MMSEKRFTLLDETIFDNEKQAEDGGRVTYWVISYGQRQRLVGLLNTLHQENQKLKEENDKYRVMINANASLNDEVYEQLKKTEKSYKECREENEQLRKEIEDLRIKLANGDNLRCDGV